MVITLGTVPNVILHLAKCGECRKELALVLTISKSIKNQTKEVPDYIMGNAFSMIPKESVLKQNTSLDVLKSTVVTLKDVLATTKKSIRLAIQFI